MMVRDSHRPVRATDSGSYKTFGRKAYLDKRAREVINRASRQIYEEEPEWVDTPDEPSTSDCLTMIQKESDANPDTGLIIELVGKGLSAQETLVWILWNHSNLEPREIWYAFEGKDHPGAAGVDDQAIRNIKSKVKSAGMKLGVNVDL